jgi:putative hydrolase of the HAD superfamily
VADLDAVTFDHWNTLVYEDNGALRGKRLAAWSGILEDAGFAVERERLDAAFAASWQRFLDAWQTGARQYTAVEAAVEIVEELGYPVPPGVHDQLVDAFTHVGDERLHLTDGLVDCLRALKDAGVRLGIVCDVGMTPSSALRANLAREGILDLFDGWSFSDDVGAYKPSPVIFDHALRGLGGIAPARAAHVGDLRRTDVAGARDFGMVAVRYSGVFDDAGDEAALLPDGDYVVENMADLPKVLGVIA